MEPLPPFDGVIDQLYAITDLGKLLAARLAFVQASQHGIATSDGTRRRHDVAMEMARLLGGARDADMAKARVGELEAPLDQAFANFDERLLASLRAGREAPIASLARTLRLGPLELRIVVALAAAEIDVEIARAYHAAYDDGRRGLDVSWLALLVGGQQFAKREAVMNALSPSGALRRHRLVVLGDGALSMKSIRLAERVIGLLRGDRSLDESIALFCRVATPPPLRDLVIDPRGAVMLRRGLAFAQNRPARVVAYGAEGIGKATLASAMAIAVGRSALRVDLATLSTGDIADRLATCGREAALRDAILVIDAPIESEASAQLGAAIADLPVTVCLVAEKPLAWMRPFAPELVEVEFLPPTYRERALVWARSLMRGAEPCATVGDVELVAGRYSFGASSITRAARAAIASAQLRDPDGELRVSLDDLVGASRAMFSHRLGNYAQLIPAGFTWSDLVLPKDTLHQLHEVVAFARARPKLLEDWGFAKKLPYGRGLSAILAGPPGTGKTMVAQLLAHELGYDLYRIDLSQVVNKYIGETEKNLARIFAEAENSHAVLFFDEADSLFAKRTDVKSSNDRYANLEVNYLLQRMETYDGVTLLATNVEQGIDEAFKRRVRFSVQFEMPDEDIREVLWKSMFPPQTPLVADIDWAQLAQRYEMSGAYIKKAALRAALAAATGDRAITLADLLAAAQQEYREMGRVTI